MKLDMIGIIVEDITKAISFYETLGFTPKKPIMENYVELNNDSIRISLNTKSMIEGVYGFEPSLTGERIELAFLCSSPKELEDTIAQIKAKGYTVFKEPWNAFWGQYYAIIKDIDGNYISLFCNTLKNET